MIRVSKNEKEVVAKLLADCFITDPLVIRQLMGIENPKDFLEKLLLLQLEVFIETIDVFSLDDNFKSIIIGYEKNNSKKFKQLLIGISLLPKTVNTLGKVNYKIYCDNLKECTKILDSKWQKKIISGNYYHVNIVAIAEEERGKGRLRSLLTNIIDYCNKENIPIILESNNTQNTPKYIHLGFDLIKTISNPDSNIEQYCFIKYPESKQKKLS